MKGWCHSHYQRWRYHGDPLVEITKHPFFKHPLFTTWSWMIRRCHDEHALGYSKYGARGVTVCDRWRNDFQAFVADMGPKPSSSVAYSVDRWPDPDGNYEPGNTRWATDIEQAHNQRPRTMHKLSAGKVMKAPKGKYADGGGLWLVKDNPITGRWSFRYMLEYKSHDLGLGSIHTITLSEAREKARQLRKKLIDGIDPLTDRRAA